ncbi:isopropylmalate isomerase [Teredinibacter waterburyi]|uniref:isopropylmalate isomerase n=1 Tax=Teredinibacter waterburyi TaxID=1500538 RepID=UPI00165F9D63|nr:isopropylmalate isomerase [Teredinibacter waterburyi]
MDRLLSEISWSPQIGDPSVVGWLTVLAYLVAAVTATLVYTKYNPPALAQYPVRLVKLRRFWLFVAITCMLLAINKQLDLQSLFTQLLRYSAAEHGWYSQRRHFQLLFIYSMVALSLVGVIGLTAYYRTEMVFIATAIVGIGLLICFVLVRSASFHHVDFLINSTLLGAKVNWLIELTGISLVIFNGTISLLASKRQV